jgi:hypothetical protein
MVDIKEWVKDYNGKNQKTLAAFLFPLIIILLLSPGVFFEINFKNQDGKAKKSNKIPKNVAITHSFIISIFIVLFYYFYLSKTHCSAI